MSLYAYWLETVNAMRQSPVFRGAMGAGAALLLLFIIILLLAGIMFLLSRYFKKHEGIKKAYRICIYCLTMISVILLLFGAIIGTLLPIVPGTVFLLLAFLLLHRYHKNKWLDARLSRMRRKIRKGREKFRRKIRQRKIGKSLRKKN